VSKFKQDLERGNAGELLFLLNNPNLEKLPGFESDFINKKTGEKYELKTDYYDMNNTENFFIELWSDVDSKKRGGPIQAKRHGSKYYCYLFIKNNIYFKIDIDYLVLFIATNEHLYQKRKIYNDSWITEGILIPRKDLIYEKISIISTTN